MKVREIVRALVSGCVVYVAMAACSSGGGPTAGAGGATGVGGHAGPAGTSGMGGAGVTSGGGDDGGIWDALTDPVPDAKADPTSGSRLKAKYRVADDGSKEYLDGSWWDSDRSENCTFVIAADGKERCLPFENLATFAYQNAGCSMPIAYGFAGCATPPYARRLDAESCPIAQTASHLYGIGQPINPAAVYVESGGACVKVGPAAAYAYYSIGAEIPASSFVAGTVLHD